LPRHAEADVHFLAVAQFLGDRAASRTLRLAIALDYESLVQYVLSL
jgi:hypothetical protein